MVAMLMVVLVTPGSVAPVALPGPQTAFRVPKSPAPEAAAAVVAVPPAVVVAVDLGDEDRLQAEANSTATIDITTTRFAARPFANMCPSPSVSCERVSPASPRRGRRRGTRQYKQSFEKWTRQGRAGRTERKGRNYGLFDRSGVAGPRGCGGPGDRRRPQHRQRLRRRP